MLTDHTRSTSQPVVLVLRGGSTRDGFYLTTRGFSGCRPLVYRSRSCPRHSRFEGDFYTVLSREIIAIIGVGILLCSLVARAPARDVRVDRIDVLRAGIYQATVAREVPDKSLVSGSRNEVMNPNLQGVGNTVPAKLGIKFGFEYRIVGEPQDAPVPIKVVTVFPTGGIRNPETGETIYREEVVRERLIGRMSGKGYGFDHTWELVPGPWRFELWYSGRKLADESFTVVAP